MTDHSSDDVLVVEDDRELNELIGAYVEIAGYKYHRALDGATALREARTRMPALVVLDVMLPDTDGFEVCRQLKSDASTREIPIVMLTALDQEENRAKGRACGAAEYLTKPFDPDRLMRVIREKAGNHTARSIG